MKQANVTIADKAWTWEQFKDISIWDTFYRADRSGSREFGGTGIGLSIVKAILQLHRGQYGAFNEDGGVTFYFTLALEVKD